MSEGRLSDAQLQDRERRAAAARQRQRDDDLRALMSTAQGRRVAYRLVFDLCDVLSPAVDTFILGIKDGASAAMHTWRRIGRQSVGTELLAVLQGVAPAEWNQAVDEMNRANQADMALDAPETSAGESL